MPRSENWATWRMAVSIPEKECVRNRFATQIWVFQHDLRDVTPLSRKANRTHHRYLQQEGFSSPLSQYGWLRSASNKSTGFVQIKNQFQIFIISTVSTSIDFLSDFVSALGESRGKPIAQTCSLETPMETPWIDASPIHWETPPASGSMACPEFRQAAPVALFKETSGCFRYGLWMQWFKQEARTAGDTVNNVSAVMIASGQRDQPMIQGYFNEPED